MKIRAILVFVIFFSLLFTCSRILEPEDQNIKIRGKIQDYYTGENIVDAQIDILAESLQDVSVKSDSTGAFEFKTEFEDTSKITIIVSKEAYYSDTTIIETAEPGKQQELGIIKLKPDYQPITISGTLYSKMDKVPIEKGRVICNLIEEQITTNVNGGFSFDIDIDQTDTIELIFKKQYFKEDTVQAGLTPEKDLDLGKIFMDYMYDPAIITGQVFDNRGDTTLSGVKVTIEEFNNVYGYTDESGQFELQAQINTPGTINLNFSKQSYSTKTVIIDPILPEDTIQIENVRLIPPAYQPLTVSGKVIDEEANPLKDVEIISEVMDSPVTTGSRGRFSFNLQIESQKTTSFIFSKEYFNDITKTVDLIPEQDENLGEVVLTNQYQKAKISGKVVDDRSGKPIQRAKVLHTATKKFVTSNEQGNFAINLQINEPQNVELKVSKYPYQSSTRVIDQLVPEEVIDSLVISLVPPAYEPINISGQVIDQDTEQPIQNVSVLINQFPQLVTSTGQYGYFNVTAQVDRKTPIDITLSKEDMYNSINIADTVRPEVDLELGQLKMDSKYDPINITGQVVKYSDNTPLENVNVAIVEFPEQTDKTDSNGEYELHPVIAEAQKIHVTFSKNSFKADTAEVEVAPNINSTVSQIPLLEEITKPASIVFISADPQDIRVKESGGEENSILTFEVRDSSGVPIDISEDTTVAVRIVTGPGGGESLYPKELKTDSQGRIRTSLTSGTVAGPVEVEASLVTEGGDKVKSNPVSLVIHAGHPDQDHFSVAAEQLNIPGLVEEGLEDEITATVGDMYGNWVADGTPVYFSTIGGVIDGSATTTDARASVILKSGGKDPELADSGFVTITAKTTDRDGSTIETTGEVLFSGHSEITNFAPSNITFGQGQSVTVTFNVWDQEYHNPLAAGTRLSVSANPDTLASVETTFPEDGLDDVQSGHTSYTLTIIDNPNSSSGGEINIKLKLNSPNNDITRRIQATLTE
ncbi:MAG: carboxypeptidase-like regulatory domain-containing protein [Candidatus Marinimicrobia bacterium]|nr:carboxypeptidase-like regulatory domain-containing protein [Candidatus Neomarinimicrobiota bacterium]